MNVLFDTQALVLWIAGAPLPKRVAALAKTEANIFISALTTWELLLKRQFRGVGFTIDLFWQALQEMRGHLLALEGPHIETYAKLPIFENHRDPFDRMLIACAGNLRRVNPGRGRPPL